jgi:hypothetical protein
MTSKRISPLILLAAVIICVSRVHSQGAGLISNWIEFYRAGQKIDAKSPDGRSTLSVLPPTNDDADPKMFIESNGRTLPLGSLERSAVAFWRPDSRVVAISDHPYSNHFVVRLVRVRPRLAEVKNVDNVIKSRVLHEFHTAGLVHYWPQVQGWTTNGHLLVVVCAGGDAPHSHLGTPLLGFQRGYLVNPDRLTIVSELPPAAYTKLAGKDVCQ